MGILQMMIGKKYIDTNKIVMRYIGEEKIRV